MTGPAPEQRDQVTPGRSQGEELVGLQPGQVRAITDGLERGDIETVETLIADLHAADVADLLERVNTEQRRLLVDLLRPRFDPAVLPELDETIRDDVIEQLGPDEVVAAVSELDTDDAIEVIADLDDEQQRALLDALPAADRALVRQGLTYEEDSAGRLMQRELVAIPAFWTVGETIDFMRASPDLPDDFYDLFVVDPKHTPIGTIPLSRVLRNRRPVRIGDVMDTDVESIPVHADQEEVAFLFRQHDLVSAPVVEKDGRLVGVITVDDVVDVIEEEHEEDLMKLGGVREDDLYDAALATTRSRFSWLLINLGTAVLASLVIAQFEATIEKIVALAILMPIVASMGGNAGTQTLTVAVRALATRELTATNAVRILGKEFLVGAFNGILFAAITGVVAWYWFDSLAIGAVIGTAMIVNMIIAGLAGVIIPVGLDRFGVDPAVASSVFLTTITDVVGFFAFLGLAAWFLM
jgi:magnesium transporter